MRGDSESGVVVALIDDRQRMARSSVGCRGIRDAKRFETALYNGCHCVLVAASVHMQWASETVCSCTLAKLMMVLVHCIATETWILCTTTYNDLKLTSVCSRFRLHFAAPFVAEMQLFLTNFNAIICALLYSAILRVRWKVRQIILQFSQQSFGISELMLIILCTQQSHSLSI